MVVYIQWINIDFFDEYIDMGYWMAVFGCDSPFTPGLNQGWTT